MTPKIKLTLLVVAAAFVSALITLFFQMTARNRYYPMPMMGMGADVGMTEPMMRGSTGDSFKTQEIELQAPSTMTSEMGNLDTYSTRPYLPPIYNQDDALDVDERAVEMSSSQSVVVNDVAAYLQRNKDYIESVDGRVLSFNQGTQSNQGLFSRPITYGYFDARVPVDQFDEVNNQLGQGVKKVVYQNRNQQDITGQVVSIEEQLIALKDELAEAQIKLDMVEDDLEKRRVQIEIDRIERQIEALENRQESVDQQVTYAVVSVSAANNEEYFTPSWRSNWSDMLWMVFGSFSGFAYIIGSLVIWTALYSILWLPIMLGARSVRRMMARK